MCVCYFIYFILFLFYFILLLGEGAAAPRFFCIYLFLLSLAKEVDACQLVVGWFHCRRLLPLLLLHSKQQS